MFPTKYVICSRNAIIGALPKMRFIIQIKFYDRRSNRSIIVNLLTARGQEKEREREIEREREKGISHFTNTRYDGNFT